MKIVEKDTPEGVTEAFIYTEQFESLHKELYDTYGKRVDDILAILDEHGIIINGEDDYGNSELQGDCQECCTHS